MGSETVFRAECAAARPAAGVGAVRGAAPALRTASGSGSIMFFWCPRSAWAPASSRSAARRAIIRSRRHPRRGTQSVPEGHSHAERGNEEDSLRPEGEAVVAILDLGCQIDGLFAILFGLLLVDNPMATGEPVGGRFINLVLLGYALPAVLLTGLALLTRNSNNVYYPNRWAAMDGGDLDFPP